MAKKVIVLLADGFEEIEALSAVDIFRRAGVECKMCSIKSEKRVVGSREIVVEADITINEIGSEEIDALVLPGGQLGAANLRKSSEVSRLLKAREATNKTIIAAICAGPTVLEGLGMLVGKKATSYPGVLAHPGDCNYIEDKICVVDEHVITSRGPATAPYFAFEILNELGLYDRAEALYEGMLYGFLKERLTSGSKNADVSQ